MRKIALLMCLLGSPATAHEFWLEPTAYQVPAGGMLTANIVNGQDFEGVILPYVPQRFTHFMAFAGGKSGKVEGRTGDTPALNMAAFDNGLNVVAYQARNSTVSYETWEKFESFLKHKDLGDQLANHQARGLPLENFKEVYSRYSKTLIGVGDGAGADRRVGLETEIVALTNPYTDSLSSGMRVQVFYRTDPRVNTQVEVFEKAPNDSVRIFFVRTNVNGIATVSVKSGHEYMLDAVVLRDPTGQLADDTGAAYETLWANMTFAAP